MYKKALFVKDDKKDFVNKDEVFNFCNRCFYENKKRKAKVNIKGTEIKFIEKVMINTKTNEEVFNLELEKENDKILDSLYRKKLGLLFPEEIKEIREKNNLTQEEFNTLLGFNKNCIKRFENGSVQNKEEDLIIRKYMKL